MLSLPDIALVGFMKSAGGSARAYNRPIRLWEFFMSDPLLGPSSPLALPIYQSSVYNLPDLDALDRVMDGLEPGFIYARDGHPNAQALAEKLARLESAKWAVVCGSGMAALSAAFLSLVSAGNRVIVSDSLYGRTNRLIRQELARLGVKSTAVDVGDLDAVTDSIRGARKRPARRNNVQSPLPNSGCSQIGRNRPSPSGPVGCR